MVQVIRINGKGRYRNIRPFPAFRGSNRIPLSYVDNCAEAIVLAGLTKGMMEKSSI